MQKGKSNEISYKRGFVTDYHSQFIFVCGIHMLSDP